MSREEQKPFYWGAEIAEDDPLKAKIEFLNTLNCPMTFYSLPDMSRQERTRLEKELRDQGYSISIDD